MRPEARREMPEGNKGKGNPLALTPRADRHRSPSSGCETDAQFTELSPAPNHHRRPRISVAGRTRLRLGAPYDSSLHVPSWHSSCISISNQASRGASFEPLR